MNDKDEILNRLRNISFHDIPVEKISFKTDPSTDFKVDFALFNEEKDDYDYLTINFIDIIELNADKLILNKDSDIEIFRFSYQWNNIFEGEIRFLLGFGQPDFLVKIKCQKVEIVKTL